MDRTVHVTSLGSLVGAWTVNVIGARVSENRDLRCAVAPGSRRGSYSSDLVAAEADCNRWCAATERLVATIGALQEKERLVSLHLHPPWQGRLRWRLRYAQRNRLLRRQYDHVKAELLAEFDAALAEYQVRAGDLPEYQERYRRQEQQRLKREQEQARLRREAAVASDTDPRWTYQIRELSGDRCFCIYQTGLEHPYPAVEEVGLTPVEIQAELVAERAEHPYTSVMWALETGQALREKYQTEVAGWQALTGIEIEPFPRDPNKPRSNRRNGVYGIHGSDYGSGHFGCFGSGF
ncbi:hypothetical protein AB0L63_12475 [Nocardia sp. NPDC051990]|uniref:hypothetical protein n=1 Tax=Nocardia sp. NPDC051990 TaxID=3155285 RepID=UPI003422780F